MTELNILGLLMVTSPLASLLGIAFYCLWKEDRTEFWCVVGGVLWMLVGAWLLTL